MSRAGFQIEAYEITEHIDERYLDRVVERLSGSGRVARPFGFALTDPGMRLSRTRLFLKVTRIMLHVASMGA